MSIAAQLKITLTNGNIHDIDYVQGPMRDVILNMLDNDPIGNLQTDDPKIIQELTEKFNEALDSTSEKVNLIIASYDRFEEDSENHILPLYTLTPVQFEQLMAKEAFLGADNHIKYVEIDCDYHSPSYPSWIQSIIGTEFYPDTERYEHEIKLLANYVRKLENHELLFGFQPKKISKIELELF